MSPWKSKSPRFMVSLLSITQPGADLEGAESAPVPFQAHGQRIGRLPQRSLIIADV